MGPLHQSVEHPSIEMVLSLPVAAAVVGADGRVVTANDDWHAFVSATGSPAAANASEAYLDVCRRAADDPFATEMDEALEQLLGGDLTQYRTTCSCQGHSEPRRFDVVACRLELDDGPLVLVLHLDRTAGKRGAPARNEDSERLEVLARVLSHDLKTPLSVASGYARLLEEEADPDSEHAVKVQSALDRIDTIAENAVTLARDRDVEDPDELPLEDVARHVWTGLDPDGGSLTVRAAPVVEADRDLVSELLENLFRNALDHAGEEPEVVVGPLPDGGGFYVADDGPGIPPDVRDDVFEVGYTTGDGTGFGLDIVERIAGAHDWGVRARESAAGGARFELLTDVRY
jgi:signal transduction histidine kinase